MCVCVLNLQFEYTCIHVHHVVHVLRNTYSKADGFGSKQMLQIAKE